MILFLLASLLSGVLMPDCRSYPVAPINALSKNMSFKLLSVMLPTMDAVDFNTSPPIMIT